MIFRVLAFMTLFLPSIGIAHTRWFADSQMPEVPVDEPGWLYLMVWMIIAGAAIAIGIYVERRGALQLQFLHPKAGHSFARAASVFSMVSGAFLVIAGTHEYLFSPNLTIESGVPAYLIYAQILIGAACVLGVFARMAGVGLAFLWILGIVQTGIVASIENIWVLSAALFIIIVGNDYFSLVAYRELGKHVKRFKEYAMPVLRIGTGGTLLTLGFSEKILNPSYGLNFLVDHPWNFMQLFGLPFSDYLFTISAGSVEALLGALLILGVATRMVAIVIAIFFTIPLFILGPIELTGHMPHFAAVILLVLFGAGPHLKVASRKRS